MHRDVERILLTKEQIDDKVESIAKEIDRDYANTVPVLLCILNGGVVFAVDLMRQMKVDVEIDFMQVSSYGKGMQSKGEITILKDAYLDLKGRDVIVIEDIADTCITLKEVLKKLKEHQPKSLRLCVLINKTGVRKPSEEIDIDYKGFDIPNVFAVGYGLDYANRYRDLPYVGILKPKVYDSEK
ncbi:MAG: hypoxanthine phosphoribosyltransferase [Eubacteriaceae bacterium]|jgi:hypoxanthine phosphoribosyltransferase|nr:hypoxanthine phosphoribosyltransferase [Eubacteriaceae bacterium]